MKNVKRDTARVSIIIVLNHIIDIIIEILSPELLNNKGAKQWPDQIWIQFKLVRVWAAVSTPGFWIRSQMPDFLTSAEKKTRKRTMIIWINGS